MTFLRDSLVPKAQHKAKLAVAQTALVALGAGFEFLSQRSPEMRNELSRWEEGHTLALGVLPHGPYVTIRYTDGTLQMLGTGATLADGADLKVLFKNVDAAVLVPAGQLGAHTAFAEHRAIVHGDIAKAMQANRAMAIVVKFLFPGLMLRRITRRMPVLTARDLLLKAKLYAALAPKLIRGFLL